MEGGDETEEEMEGGKEETYLSRSRQRRCEGESSGGVAFHGEEREMRSVPTSPCFFSPCAEVWINTRVDWGGLTWAKNRSQRFQMQFLGRPKNSPPRGLNSTRRGFSARFHPIPSLPKRGFREFNRVGGGVGYLGYKPIRES
jgi:hypothetical protein